MIERVVILLALVAAPASAADWPHWRGPARDGISAEHSGFKEGRWNIDKHEWHTSVGKGCSSVIAVDGKLYATGWKSGKDMVSCLDAATGKEVWSRTYPCPLYGRKALGDQGQYGGPSATPEFDVASRFLYTLSIDGDLYCWDTTKKGEPVWSANLHKNYKVIQRPQVGTSGHRDYGFTSAPLVVGDWVLVEVGAAEGIVVAFDKATGKEVWRSEAKGPGGHTGGLVHMTVDKVPCVAVLTHFHLAVLRLDKGNEGKTVATYPWVTEFSNSIATPAVHGQHILITSAYNKMAICKLKITLGGAEKVWETKFPSGVCSPIIYRDRVYLAWKTIRCLDFETGKQVWSGANINTPGSCIVTADDRLVVWGKSGELFLVDTAVRSPEKFNLLAHNDRVLGDLAWPHVVLSDGRIYCKDRAGNVVCFRVATSDPKQ